MVEAYSSSSSDDNILLQYIRLPRLISLERRYRSSPHDASSRRLLLGYALYLYNCRVDPLLIDIFKRKPLINDSRLDNCMILPQFDFNTVFDYVLAVRYWLSRIVICATLQRLIEEDSALHTLNSSNALSRAALEAEEIESAENIARCWHYALDPGWDPPLPALRLSMALTVAYGTWHRLEKRCIGRDDAASRALEARATRMKELCVRILARRTSMWDCRAEEHRETALDCRVSLETVTL